MKKTWPQVALSEVLKPVSRPERVDPAATYPILGAHWYAQGLYTKDVLTGAEIQASQVYRVQEGDFVYNRLFGWKGSFAIADAENSGCYVSNEFPCFDVNQQRLDGRFLWRYFSLPAVWDEVLGLSTGGTPTSRNRLKEVQLLQMRIPLPPLDEQRCIVARIEELSAKIEEARTLRRQTTESAEALFLAALSAIFDGESERRGRTRIEYLLTEAGYGSSEKCDSERVEGATPILRIPNVASEQINLADLKYARLSERDSERLLLGNGDVLVVRTNGSLDLVGRSAVVPKLEEPFGFASYLIRLRFDPNRIESDYAQRMLQHLRVAGVLVDFARTTAGQYNVSLGRLRAAEIPVPPIPEQRRIVEYLDGLQAKVDDLTKIQEDTSKELDALMPSILSKAFSG